VNRRPLATTVAAAALALALTARTAPARADGITPNTPGTATYRLTTDAAIAAPDPNATAPQVVAKIVPPGTVIPPTQTDGTQGSPLTILSSSTGFDQSQLIVALKDQVTNAGSPPDQLFGLSFFGTGFQKDGKLDFSLNIDKSLTTPPTLESLTPGVSIVALPQTAPATSTVTTAPTTPTTTAATTTTTTTTTSLGTPGGTQVPEPAAVVLWSVVIGAGLLRAKSLRRRAA
jgi:hypothetical protein